MAESLTARHDGLYNIDAAFNQCKYSNKLSGKISLILYILLSKDFADALRLPARHHHRIEPAVRKARLFDRYLKCPQRQSEIRSQKPIHVYGKV